MFAPSESTPQEKSSELSPSSTRAFLLKENEVVYDECFVVRKSRFRLFVSKKLDGEQVITATTAESSLLVTRFHLKGDQEGWPKGCTQAYYKRYEGNDK